MQGYDYYYWLEVDEEYYYPEWGEMEAQQFDFGDSFYRRPGFGFRRPIFRPPFFRPPFFRRRRFFFWPFIFFPFF